MGNILSTIVTGPFAHAQRDFGFTNSDEEYPLRSMRLPYSSYKDMRMAPDLPEIRVPIYSCDHTDEVSKDNKTIWFSLNDRDGVRVPLSLSVRYRDIGADHYSGSLRKNVCCVFGYSRGLGLVHMYFTEPPASHPLASPPQDEDDVAVSEDDACPICMSLFRETPFLKRDRTGCGHVFHSDCIAMWESSRATNNDVVASVPCPCCKRSL